MMRQSLKSFIKEVHGHYMWCHIAVFITPRGYEWGLLNANTYELLCHNLFNPNRRESEMKFGSAYYRSEPNPEIYVFVDEEPKGLPDDAIKIGEETERKKFLALLEPYFVLAKNK